MFRFPGTTNANEQAVKDLEIKTYPDPCLRIKTVSAGDFDDGLSETARAMSELMYVSGGIGLAATQVGLGISIMVVDIGGGLVPIVNPELMLCSEERDAMEEGCLSLPGVSVNVARPRNIEVKYNTLDGGTVRKRFEGLMAKVVQHEMDHLRGTLLIDHENPFSRFLDIVKLRHKKIKTGGRC